MKKNKNIIYLLITILSSFIISLALEYYIFNHNQIKYNKLEKPEIQNIEGMEKENNYYIVTDEKGSVELKLNDNYINAIDYKYVSEVDFFWEMSYIKDGNEVNINQSSTSFINRAYRVLNQKVDDNTIKVTFYGKGIKIKDIKIDNSISINWYRIFLISLSIVFISIVIKYRKYLYNNIEKAFLAISLFIGIFMLIIPPNYGSTCYDDQIHIKQIYTFFNKENVKWPSSIDYLTSYSHTNNSNNIVTKEELRELEKKLNKVDNDIANIQINNYSSKYSKFVYLPYSIGFKIGNILNLSFTLQVILSKFLNLLLYILLIYYAIKIIPFAKKLVFIMGLLPTSIFLATQFSYDSTIIAGIYLGLAAFIKLLSLEKIEKKYLLVFILSIIWASLPKAVYSPILLLLFFLPSNKFNSKKEELIIKSSIIILTLLMVSTFALPMLTTDVGGDIRGGDTSVSRQIKFIISNPLTAIIIFVKFALKKGLKLIIGNQTIINLGYLPIRNTGLYLNTPYYLYLVLMLYVTFTERKEKKSIPKNINIIFILLCILLIFGIYLALYLSFTPVGLNTINGVQSRYFIPLLLIILVSIIPYGKEKEIKDSKIRTLVVLLLPYLILLYNVIYILFLYRK